MTPRNRRRISKVLFYLLIIYVFIWMIRPFSKNCNTAEGGTETVARYSKAISPSRNDVKALAKAVVECKAELMYEVAPSKCLGKPLVLLLVVSSPNSIIGRQMLRKYLATVPSTDFYNEGPAWQLVFVVARTNNPFLEKRIQEEISIKKDIILGRYKDNKRNLVIKTLIGLGWACCSCLPKFLIKANDDVFINIRITINWLFEITNGTFNKSKLYMGISTIGHDPRPIRNKKSHLFVSEEDYPHETFAPYIIGEAYLISKDVLLSVISHVPQQSLFSVEDAYIGMLAAKIGVSPQGNKGFLRHSKPYTWHTCDYRRILASLNAMPNDLPEMFEESLRSERGCLPEMTLFPQPVFKNNSSVDETQTIATKASPPSNI